MPTPPPSLAEFRLLHLNFLPEEGVDVPIEQYVEALIEKHWNLIKNRQGSNDIKRYAVYSFALSDIARGPFASIFQLSEKQGISFLENANSYLMRATTNSFGSY